LTRTLTLISHLEVPAKRAFSKVEGGLLIRDGSAEAGFARADERE
jgi:hypothetical protein